MPNPTKVAPLDDLNLYIEFDSGEKSVIPYLDLRFECPCATCVDEITGQRTLRKEDLNANVKPISIAMVGRYALQITWNDGHNTGMYHFDRLYQLAKRYL